MQNTIAFPERPLCRGLRPRRADLFFPEPPLQSAGISNVLTAMMPGCQVSACLSNHFRVALQPERTLSPMVHERYNIYSGPYAENGVLSVFPKNITPAYR